MRRFLRAALKIGVVVGAVLAFSFGAPLIAAGGLGYLAFRLVDNINPNGSPRSDERGDAKTNGRNVKEGRSVSRGLLSGWRLSGLPIDMSVDSVKGRDTSFTAAGIKGLVTAHQRGLYGSVDYSLSLQNQGMAEQADKVIKDKGLDAKVVRDRYGKFSVVCSDVNLVNEMAKALYPLRDVEVERQQEHHRQYLVSGMGSYEEAEQFLKNNPNTGGKLVNSFIKVTDVIDGKVAGQHLQNGSLDNTFNNGTLPVGSFIVDMVEQSVCKGVSSVPAGTTDVSEHVFSHFIAASGNIVTGEPSFCNGTPDGISRTITLGDTKEKVIMRDLRAASRMNAYFCVDSYSELKNLCNLGIPSGSEVRVGIEMPMDLKGKYVVELPLHDSRILNMLRCDASISASQHELLKLNGYDSNAFDLSYIIHSYRSDLKCNGAKAFLSEIVDQSVLGEVARCNGVPFNVCLNRLNEERLPELSPEKLRQWGEDFNEVRMVNFDIDPSRNVVKITSVIGDSKMKTEELPLDKEQMNALVSRGAISKTEMTDMLMQLHPDYFMTYTAGGGRSSLDNPVESFVRGTRPEPARKGSVITRQPVLPKVKKGSQHKL